MTPKATGLTSRQNSVKGRFLRSRASSTVGRADPPLVKTASSLDIPPLPTRVPRSGPVRLVAAPHSLRALEGANGSSDSRMDFKAEIEPPPRSGSIFGGDVWVGLSA